MKALLSYMTKDITNLFPKKIAGSAIFFFIYISALQQLIHQAHTFQADIRDGKIVFEMIFSFCDWIPRP